MHMNRPRPYLWLEAQAGLLGRTRFTQGWIENEQPVMFTSLHPLSYYIDIVDSQQQADLLDAPLRTHLLPAPHTQSQAAAASAAAAPSAPPHAPLVSLEHATDFRMFVNAQYLRRPFGPILNNRWELAALEAMPPLLLQRASAFRLQLLPSPAYYIRRDRHCGWDALAYLHAAPEQRLVGDWDTARAELISLMRVELGQWLHLHPFHTVGGQTLEALDTLQSGGHGWSDYSQSVANPHADLPWLNEVTILGIAALYNVDIVIFSNSAGLDQQHSVTVAYASGMRTHPSAVQWALINWQVDQYLPLVALPNAAPAAPLPPASSSSAPASAAHPPFTPPPYLIQTLLHSNRQHVLTFLQAFRWQPWQQVIILQALQQARLPPVVAPPAAAAAAAVAAAAAAAADGDAVMADGARPPPPPLIRWTGQCPNAHHVVALVCLYLRFDDIAHVLRACKQWRSGVENMGHFGTPSSPALLQRTHPRIANLPFNCIVVPERPLMVEGLVHRPHTVTARLARMLSDRLLSSVIQRITRLGNTSVHARWDQLKPLSHELEHRCPKLQQMQLHMGVLLRRVRVPDSTEPMQIVIFDPKDSSIQAKLKPELEIIGPLEGMPADDRLLFPTLRFIPSLTELSILFERGVHSHRLSDLACQAANELLLLQRLVEAVGLLKELRMFTLHVCCIWPLRVSHSLSLAPLEACTHLHTLQVTLVTPIVRHHECGQAAYYTQSEHPTAGELLLSSMRRMGQLRCLAQEPRNWRMVLGDASTAARLFAAVPAGGDLASFQLGALQQLRGVCVNDAVGALLEQLQQLHTLHADVVCVSFVWLTHLPLLTNLQLTGYYQCPRMRRRGLNGPGTEDVTFGQALQPAFEGGGLHQLTSLDIEGTVYNHGMRYNGYTGERYRVPIPTHPDGTASYPNHVTSEQLSAMLEHTPELTHLRLVGVATAPRTVHALAFLGAGTLPQTLRSLDLQELHLTDPLRQLPHLCLLQQLHTLTWRVQHTHQASGKNGVMSEQQQRDLRAQLLERLPLLTSHPQNLHLFFTSELEEDEYSRFANSLLRR